jgi:hypothetical protein
MRKLLGFVGIELEISNASDGGKYFHAKHPCWLVFVNLYSDRLPGNAMIFPVSEEAKL